MGRITAVVLVLFACLLTGAARAADFDLVWGAKVPMRDGVKLGATIAKPHNLKSRLPAIVIISPYIAADNSWARASYFAQHGYVYVMVDARGRGDSGGSFDPFAQEPRDGYDAIEWVAHQPWCNGKVVMWGGSYAGFDQWATLEEHPPHLAGIVPASAVYPAVDFGPNQGIFTTYFMQWLTYTSGAALQTKLFDDGEFWGGKFNDYFYGFRPYRTLDGIVGNRSTVFQKWLKHPSVDGFWDAMVPSPAQYAAINVPILTIAGQYDGDQLGAMTYYRRFMQYARPQERDRMYLVMGPWNHLGTRTPTLELGGLKFGAASKLDMNDLHRQWYDHVLKGGPLPSFLKRHVAYWVTGSEDWRYADSLAALTADKQRYFLGSNGRADDAEHSGLLVEKASGSSAYDTYVYDPLDLRPQKYSDNDNLPPLLDQSFVTHAFGEADNYTTAPFTAAVTILGFPRIVAYLSTDVPDTDLQVQLFAINPDGTAVALSSQILRARYRNSFRTPEFLTPNKVERFTFDQMTFFARSLPAGSRLRLAIGALNSSAFERNYNAARDVADETAKDARTAHVRIYHTAQYPSFLEVSKTKP